MMYLGLDYATSYLLFDLIACLPGLLYRIKNYTTNIFSFFRLLRVTRILAYLKFIFTEISFRYQRQRVVIENMYLIIRSLFIFAFIAHSLVCIFIAIGFIFQNSSEGSWLKGESNYLGTIGESSKIELYQLS